MKYPVAILTQRANRMATATMLATCCLGPLAWGAPGDLDPTFGELGRVELLPEPPGDARTIELLDNGEFVVAGGLGDLVGVYETIVHASGFAMRLSGTGTPDPAFAMPVLAGIEVHDLAGQADGRIVGVGRSLLDAGMALAVFRFQPDGTLDPLFGDAGVVYYAPDEGSYAARSVVVEPDGRIVVSGTRDGRWFVLALDTSGDIDTTFGDSGLYVGPAGTYASTPVRSVAGRLPDRRHLPYGPPERALDRVPGPRPHRQRRAGSRFRLRRHRICYQLVLFSLLVDRRARRWRHCRDRQQWRAGIRDPPTGRRQPRSRVLHRGRGRHDDLGNGPGGRRQWLVPRGRPRSRRPRCRHSPAAGQR